MRDLVELLVFHDERILRGRWLYHGFILTEVKECPVLIKDLIDSHNKEKLRL